MNDNTQTSENDRWTDEQKMRRRLLLHVESQLDESVIATVADAFHDLLLDADEKMATALLLPIFEWSDFWPTHMATEILGLPTDDEYGWDELLEHFEAQERRESNCEA